MKTRLSLQALESRDVPAAVSISYTDIDGDLVKIIASVPGLSRPPLDASDLTFTDGNPDGQLARLNLTDPQFANASVTFAITREGDGDGLAHVGFIDANGVNLNRVKVQGDLGKIVAGNAVTASAGLNVLDTRSIGTLGLFTQGGTGDLNSNITGKLGALRVSGDFTHASLVVNAAESKDGRIGSIFIGGSLIGGSSRSSGRIHCDGTIGLVRIAHDITGSDGIDSGQISAARGLGPVSIGGSMRGGAGAKSGQVFSGGPMGSVTIGGDVIGGAGADSGSIFCSSTDLEAPCTIANVTIGGSLRGDAPGSGRIFALKSLGHVKIGRDVAGGIGNDSGSINSRGTTTRVTIGGSLLGADGARTGRVYSRASMGAVKVAGDVVGGEGDESGSIYTDGGLGLLSIGGNLIGAGGLSSGSVTTDDLGNARIGGSIRGGSGTSSGNIGAYGDKHGLLIVRGDIVGGVGESSGVIVSFGRPRGVSLGGSLLGGDGKESGVFLLDHPGFVIVKGNVAGAGGERSGIIQAIILSGLKIGGSLTGGTGDFSGQITSGASLGPVTISGDVTGGEGLWSGAVISNDMSRILVGGSVRGGANTLSGSVFGFQELGLVTIMGDLIGGGGKQTGQVYANSGIDSVRIGGSVFGGGDIESGRVFSFGDLGTIVIDGDLVGSSASETGHVMARRIGSVTLGGSLIAGTDIAPGPIHNNGAILAENDLGDVVIKGNLLGNATNPAIIASQGNDTSSSGLAIGSVRVFGRVEYGHILGGFDRFGSAVNADAQIGAVVIGGDWLASSIVAGVTAGANGYYGDGDDTKMSGIGVRDKPELISRIGSVTIGGQAIGTFGGVDHFGIVAEQIDRLQVGSRVVALTPGASNDSISISLTNDLRLLEVS